MKPIDEIRRELRSAELDASVVPAEPLTQFERWFADARAADLPQPTAMTLATADSEGRPSARAVLLKEVSARGLVFFSHYSSQKARDLAGNNRAALLFFWPELERQVRVQGRVEKISAADSDAFYASRPLGARIAAWASTQSDVVASRVELQARVSAFEAEFGQNPPRPAQWGGYRVVPQIVEFWQGREDRLHDRIRYRLARGKWHIERLAP